MGAGLSAPIGCMPTLSVTQQRRCSCSCSLWRYISIMPVSFTSPPRRLSRKCALVFTSCWRYINSFTYLLTFSFNSGVSEPSFLCGFAPCGQYKEILRRGVSIYTVVPTNDSPRLAAGILQLPARPHGTFFWIQVRNANVTEAVFGRLLKTFLFSL